MMPDSRRSICLSWCAAVLLGCSGSTSDPSPSPPPPPSFTPVVALNATLSGSEPVSAYAGEFAAAYATGARGAQIAAPWQALNPTGTTYDLTVLANPYFGTAALAGQGFATILLNLPIITVGTRSMPADIVTLPFDDPVVLARYRALLDQVLPYLTNEVRYVALGNEVDTYLAAHPTEWAAYWTLIEDARAYLATLRPAVMVGVTTTFDGATGAHADEVAALNANMDVVILTYYPIDGTTFVPRAPTSVAFDFAAMVAVAGDKPVVLQECGCPSSTVLASSEDLQAAFVSAAFAAWRTFGSDRFPFISFFKLRDWNDAHCMAISGGQSAGQPFYEFLRSLGLEQNDATAKLAFAALLSGIAGIGQ